MKTIIIDDENRSSDNLRMLIEENCPFLEIMHISNDSRDGIDKVLELKPTLLFLDIEMPFADGFAVMKAVKEVNPRVIFTTAFSDYAVKAFRAEAVDYLLKPVDPEELRNAVEKVRKLPVSNLEVVKRLEALESHFVRQRPAKLAIQGVEGYSLLDYNEIVYLSAASNYTHVQCKNGKKHTVARVLKEFEEQLSGSGFFRVHSSFLVNLSHVVRYQRGDGGYLFMSDGTQIEVSRSRKKELMKVLLGEE
jgi:two-component system LytT family response regulator